MFSKFRIIVNDGNTFNVDSYYESGLRHLSSHKSTLTAKLDQFIDYKTGLIDGEKLEKEWFKEIRADIFLSHSHADEKLAIALAGWLKTEMGLNAFVDSCVWGFANDLLDKINNNFNLLRTEADGSKTYSHDKANYAASHIYLMLNSALNNMINKTESFMFINTANSTIYMDKNQATAYTLSPWIYSEVVMANTMKITPPVRPIRIEKRAEFYHMMNESMNITHKLDFSDFVDINLSGFRTWKILKKSGEHALDALYRITGKETSIYG